MTPNAPVVLRAIIRCSLAVRPSPNLFAPYPVRPYILLVNGMKAPTEFSAISSMLFAINLGNGMITVRLFFVIKLAKALPNGDSGGLA